MQNVLFFGQNGFYKRDYERFDIKKLAQNYNINFIDLSNLCKKKFYQEEKGKFFKSKILIKVNSLEEFKKILIKKNLYVLLIYHEMEILINSEKLLMKIK